MVTSRAGNINQLWAGIIVEELLRIGINRFVLSPGSRCSPLTIAIASERGAEVATHFDERGAAFYALGYARATGKPAALVCTSGTATANYYPAVIEAAMDMIPMVVLTADRPAELRDTGANQTINQVELYGKYARYFCDLTAPDRSISARTVLKAVNEAARAAMNSPCGPAHVNCQFREPLTPTGNMEDFKEYLSDIRDWVNGVEPFAIFPNANKDIPGKQMSEMVTKVNNTTSGLVVAGALSTDSEVQAVLALAQKLNWPIFADILSGLRFGTDDSGVIHYFDQLLLSDKLRQNSPDMILHFGDVMTSKRYLEYVADIKCPQYIHIAGHPFRHDPAGVVTEKMEADIASFCARLSAVIEKKPISSILLDTVRMNEIVRQVIEDTIDQKADLNEISAARLVSKYIDKDAGLFLGSSMPIRDMDMYAVSSGNPVRVAANRGASGIDGCIATTAGWAAGLEKPVTAVIGDIAFLHDINSLMLLKNSRQPVALIVINNNGGGIFSFLQVYDCKDVFEKYFGTPHYLSCGKFAEAFGLDYFRPENTDSFVKTYHQVQRAQKSCVIEIVTEREANRTLHLDLQAKIQSAISKESLQ